jgi:hypothetical protein
MKLHAPLMLLLLVVVALAPGHGGTLDDPILDEGVRAEIVDVVQLPATSGGTPRTRINVLAEVPDGSGRLFVNDLRGPLYVVDGTTVTTYLDFAAIFPDLKTSPGLATGFVSFAFHPDFASNGLFYTVHTEDVGATAPNLVPALPTAISHHSILTEFTATDPSADVFSGTRRELMRIAAPRLFHNLGQVAFDPNLPPAHPDYGLLYIGAGDFGSVANGEPEQLQRLDTPLGAVMRIDPLGGPFVRGGTTYAYGIPAGNPYATDGDPDTLDEIFLHGVRNAHRLVWDTAGNGTLFVTDIGEANFEEVNVAHAGANYGWPVREGSCALDPDVDPGVVFPLPVPDDPGYTYPCAQYDHGDGRAIAGGVVVRGAGIVDLEGQLLVGDIVNGRIFYADVAEALANDDGDPETNAQVYELTLVRQGAPTTLLALVGDAIGDPGVSRTDLRLARGLSGEVYLTTKGDGFVRRLAAAPSAIPVLPAPLLPFAALGLALAARLMGRRTRSRSS